jgi:protein MpaA
VALRPAIPLLAAGAAAALLAPAAQAGVQEHAAGLSLDVPAGWQAAPLRLTRVAGPVQRLVLASYPIRQSRPDAGCLPRTAVARLPADGALVVVRERLGLRPRALARFAPRPRRFRLGERQRPVRADGCFAGGHRRFRFREGGRAFDVSVWLGSGASGTTRAAVESSLASLEVAPAVVGRSRAGRPIRLVEQGEPGAQPRILVVGCIHGDECAAAAVVARLLRAPVSAIDLWVVPTLNPDGRARGTRQNARGVDLNRNFPAGWRPSERGSRYWSGPAPGSEPETRAAMRLIDRLRPDVTVWFHQPETNVRSGGGSAALARRYARLVGLPYRALPVPPGAATRWQTARFPGTQAFVVELPPGRLSDADAAGHARAIRALVREGFPTPGR